MSGKWPFPGDLPVDRARQVCLQYREALRSVAPHACAAIDKAAVDVGEGWVVGGHANETGDDLVPVPRAAELVGRSVRWVYNWASENPDLVVGKPIRVRLRDVQTAVAHERARRSNK